MSRPAGSWLAAYGTRRCETCETVFPEHWDTCPGAIPLSPSRPHDGKRNRPRHR